MNEQLQMMMDNVKQFCEQAIKDQAITFEREGIPESMFQAFRDQGFIGANLPSSMGGAELDRQGYDAILFRLAEYSPSAAFYVYMNNSIILPLLSGAGMNDLAGEVMKGTVRIGLASSNLLEGTGDHDPFLSTAVFPSEHMIKVENGKVLLVRGKFQHADRKSLGLRGLGVGMNSFEAEESKELGRKESLEKLMLGSSWEQSAIFMGLSKGALDKAIEYTKVRKTFNYPLKDYSPVAFRLSELMSDLEFMTHFLFSEEGEQKGLMLKARSSDFSRKATKYALQYHGGYGYLEDFGVEKFYRDSVALSSLMFRPEGDKKALAESIYGSKSGYL